MIHLLTLAQCRMQSRPKLQRETPITKISEAPTDLNLVLDRRGLGSNSVVEHLPSVCEASNADR
jgi:hypothetical protein